MFQLNRTVLLLAGPLAAAALTAAPAHAVPPPDVATATSSAANGMHYSGSSANNDVRVTLSGGSFIVDDVVPIQALAGCSAIAGDAQSRPVIVAVTRDQPGRPRLERVQRGHIHPVAGVNHDIGGVNGGPQRLGKIAGPLRQMRIGRQNQPHTSC